MVYIFKIVHDENKTETDKKLANILLCEQQIAHPSFSCR